MSYFLSFCKKGIEKPAIECKGSMDIETVYKYERKQRRLELSVSPNALFLWAPEVLYWAAFLSNVVLKARLGVKLEM